VFVSAGTSDKPKNFVGGMKSDRRAQIPAGAVYFPKKIRNTHKKARRAHQLTLRDFFARTQTRGKKLLGSGFKKSPRRCLSFEPPVKKVGRKPNSPWGFFSPGASHSRVQSSLVFFSTLPLRARKFNRKWRKSFTAQPPWKHRQSMARTPVSPTSGHALSFLPS